MARKESSSELSSLAAEVLSDPNATDREKRLAASVLSQDETPGGSGRPARPLDADETPPQTETDSSLPEEEQSFLSDSKGV
jgi:hypothetical protein